LSASVIPRQSGCALRLFFSLGEIGQNSLSSIVVIVYLCCLWTVLRLARVKWTNWVQSTCRRYLMPALAARPDNAGSQHRACLALTAGGEPKATSVVEYRRQVD